MVPRRSATFVLSRGHEHNDHKSKRARKATSCLAAVILSISSRLPKTTQGRHVCSQILRSGTAGAANYGEARAAESRADFIHKLKVVSKELNETTIWLEVIGQSSMISRDAIADILAENRELCRIIAASIKTARANE